MWTEAADGAGASEPAADAPAPAAAGGGAIGSTGIDSGDWNVYYLCLHNVDCRYACLVVWGMGRGCTCVCRRTIMVAACCVGRACSANRTAAPVTSALLDAVPRGYGHAFFSALAPGARVHAVAAATGGRA